MKALVDYVVLHFKTEEDGFSKHHYSHEVEHKAIHQKFLADATAAVAGGVNPGIIAFLKDWLVTHIKGEEDCSQQASESKIEMLIMFPPTFLSCRIRHEVQGSSLNII